MKIDFTSDDLRPLVATIVFTSDDLRPLVATIVAETLEQLAEADRKLPDGRLGFPESEASQRLGVAQHVLRDARLRGEIKGKRVGKRIMYSRDELMRFLEKDD